MYMQAFASSFTRILPSLSLALTLSLLVACESSEQAPLQSATYGENGARPLPNDYQGPTPLFSKGDRVGRTALQGALSAGETLSGRSADFLAWPIKLEAEEQIELSLWSSEWSSIYFYAKNDQKTWREVLKEAASQPEKVGLESRSLRLQASDAGEYLLIVGAVEAAPMEYILHLRSL